MVKARARTQKMALSQKATPQSFLRYGDHFLKACELLLDQEDPHDDLLFVKYYLAGHSLESILKSFLLHTGTEHKELKSRKLGHDLIAILCTASKQDVWGKIDFSEKDRQVIELLSPYYRDRQFGYCTYGLKSLPPLNELIPLCRRLSAEMAALFFRHSR